MFNNIDGYVVIKEKSEEEREDFDKDVRVVIKNIAVVNEIVNKCFKICLREETCLFLISGVIFINNFFVMKFA